MSLFDTYTQGERDFQRRIIDALAEALADGLLAEDDAHVQRSARRATRIAECASNIYGETVALSLLDQGRSESERIAIEREARSA